MSSKTAYQPKLQRGYSPRELASWLLERRDRASSRSAYERYNAAAALILSGLRAAPDKSAGDVPRKFNHSEATRAPCSPSKGILPGGANPVAGVCTHSTF